MVRYEMMWILSVNQVKHFPGKRQTFDLLLEDGEQQLELSGATLAGPLHLQGTVENIGDGCLVLQGEAEADVSLICSRCGEPYRQHFCLPVQGEFIPAESWSEDSSGEEARYAYSGDQLDLLLLLQQAFFLELPLKPLCREDCAGLCPICGINRNDHQCSCETESIDPRWQKLKDFLVEAKEKGVE